MSTGESNANTFITDRLIKGTTAINAKITLNHFILPGNENTKARKGDVTDKKLTAPFYTRLRAAIAYRRNQVQLLFASAINNYLQSLATTSSTMYHGTVSDLLRRFSDSSPEVPTEPSAIIIELSPILRSEFHANTFLDFAKKVYKYIISHWERLYSY